MTRETTREVLLRHLHELEAPLAALRDDVDRLAAWGGELAQLFLRGGRLLVAGNGGSAAQAQHLTAELVGRYRDERDPFSAIALHADTSALTAIVNDYGPDESFARQVRAHGRLGDVLLALSTSGESRNLLTAASIARRHGLVVWALTGPAPCSLAAAADAYVAVPCRTTATVQEVHQVAIHLLCEAVEAEHQRLWSEPPSRSRA
jgi:phosphoheptose isomerase